MCAFELPKEVTTQCYMGNVLFLTHGIRSKHGYTWRLGREALETSVISR